MFDIIQNRRILFGEGTIQQLPGILTALTEKTTFILAFSADAPAVKLALEAMEKAGKPYALDASLRGEPSTEDVDRIAAKAIQANAGAVVAIGGGSVMDTAKAVAMLCTNGGATEDYQMNGKPINVPALPLVAVPTTSGTGSEASKVSVVYNPRNRLKKSFYSQSMIAETVVLDPGLTVGMPRSVTVSTGIDALSHAIESYVSKNASSYTEMYSLQSMRLVAENLMRCVEAPDDLEARGNMLLASFFGGCALNAGIGLAHMIAQPLGGLLKIPHGVACAIYLPYAMEYNLDTCVDKYSEIARIFGAKGENSLELAREGVERVKRFLKALQAPDSIAEYIPKNFDLDATTETVVLATGHIKVNPRPVTKEVIRAVIEKSAQKA